MPEVSVVVPVYNVENYLEECLDSILGQSFKDIEIICVNDGSTDGSTDILSRFKKRDQRIKVIEKPNGGLSSARNKGIEEASGAYVLFVDSDDMLERHAIETVYKVFCAETVDIVTFGANCFPAEFSYPWLEECLNPRNATYKTFNTDILFRENSRPYVWRSAFKRSFLYEFDLRFREDVKFGEDQVFHFMTYPRARGVRLLSDKLYRYRVARENSLMSKSGASLTRKIRDHIRIIDVIFEDWTHQGWLKEYSEQMVGWALEFVLLDIYRNAGIDKKDLYSNLGNVLKRWAPDIDDLLIGRNEKRVLKTIMYDIDPNLSRMQVCRYYLEKRGIWACFSRLMGSLFIGKADH